MINICTTSDSNYLTKGLSLYDSIKKTIKQDFDLHYLCLDDECYDALSKLIQSKAPYSTNIYIYNISEFEAEDAELFKIKNSGFKSMFGDERANYIWKLTPYFINYLLHKIIPKGEKLMYADADICFYHSPELIFDEMSDKAVAIHTHRFSPTKRANTVSGWYNVGVMVFNNNELGNKISDMWKGWVMNPDNKYAEHFGTCGDQKYLELFEVILGRENVCVFDEDSQDLSHRAPWCTEEDGKKNVMFYHFSHFRYWMDARTKQLKWSDCTAKGEWRPSAHGHIKPYYEDYFNRIKEADELVNKYKEEKIKE